jgi:cytochrome c2
VEEYHMRFSGASRTGVQCLLVLSFIVIAPIAPAKSDSSIFKRYCSVCHSVENGKNKMGPSLAGILGRRSASIANFSYSAPMKKLGIVWTQDKLEQFLTNPPEMVPGTLMAFPGLKKGDERKALLEYLAKPDG